MSKKPEFGFVLEYVKDIETAKQFYVEVLGLEVERISPVFVQFKNFAIASDESLSGKGELELYWLVEDAEAAYEELAQKAEVMLPLKDMPFGKVFGIRDPSGQGFFVLEFAEERPSQAVN